jgi:hypothetical protein
MKIDITFKGETKKVSFTDPQARIMQRLLNGEKVTFVNEHHRDGGDFVWYPIRGFGYEHVGWRAFQGAMRAVEKAFGMGDYDNSFSDQFIK